MVTFYDPAIPLVGITLEDHFSDLSGQMNLEGLGKCRLGLGGSCMEPEGMHFLQRPGLLLLRHKPRGTAS